MEPYSPNSSSSLNWPARIAPGQSRTGGATERSFLLNVARLPARVDSNGAAILLGFSAHDIPVLVAAKLLVPLGRPRPTSVKYFCVADLAIHAGNAAWLTRATTCVGAYWEAKNGRRRKTKGRDNP